MEKDYYIGKLTEATNIAKLVNVHLTPEEGVELLVMLLMRTNEEMLSPSVVVRLDTIGQGTTFFNFLHEVAIPLYLNYAKKARSIAGNNEEFVDLFHSYPRARTLVGVTLPTDKETELIFN